MTKIIISVIATMAITATATVLISNSNKTICNGVKESQILQIVDADKMDSINKDGKLIISRNIHQENNKTVCTYRIYNPDNMTEYTDYDYIIDVQ